MILPPDKVRELKEGQTPEGKRAERVWPPTDAPVRKDTPKDTPPSVPWIRTTAGIATVLAVAAGIVLAVSFAVLMGAVR